MSGVLSRILEFISHLWTHRVLIFLSGHGLRVPYFLFSRRMPSCRLSICRIGKYLEKYGFFFSGSGEIPNYRWVQFRPIGFHKSEPVGAGLLEGWLATNSEHPDSLAIFNAFKMSIKKRFEYFRYSGVYVGPETVKYFESGGRRSAWAGKFLGRWCTAVMRSRIEPMALWL